MNYLEEIDHTAAGFGELYDELEQQDRLAAFDAHVSHRGTVDSVAKMLAAAGFQIVSVAMDQFRMRFADGSSLLRHHFIRLGFVPGWKSIVPADALQQTFETLERNLNALAAERG